jgi:hypothetical protein
VSGTIESAPAAALWAEPSLPTTTTTTTEPVARTAPVTLTQAPPTLRSAPDRRLRLTLAGVAAVAFVGAGVAAFVARPTADATDDPSPPLALPPSAKKVLVSTKDSPPPAPASPPAPTTGRSALPSAADWNVVREITVTGSSALSCETKMIREWLRISCRGTNDTGGTPTTVTVIRGGGADVYTFAQGGVTSLLLPFVEGVDLEARFSWTDKSQRLYVSWPRGTPMPASKGRFAPE